MLRRHVLARLALLAALSGAAAAAVAHHGWRWTADGRFELSGVVEKAALGNPHGVLTVDVDGEKWTVEVGQPWRNERAGLRDEMLAPGTELTVVGKRAADARERRVKAERVVIDDTLHDLYPERLR